MYMPEPTDLPNGFHAPAELAQAMADHGVEMPFQKGKLLISSNAHNQDVFWIKRGKVQVTLLSPAGRETILRTVNEGQCFGEMAAIDGARRSANVTALSDGIALCMNGETFLNVLRQSGDLSLWFMRLYTRQIRELTDRIYELSTYGVAARLHCEILRLVMQNGVESGPCILRRAPTHAELAARIGTNRESVTREMGLIADAGVLNQKGRTLTIYDVAKLRALVGDKMG